MRQIAGSEEKLQRVKDGENLEAILNEGKDPLYHLKRVGEVANGSESDILAAMSQGDYESAKAVNRHKGFYRKWKNQRVAEIEKSIRSLREQIDIHQDKIDNP